MTGATGSTADAGGDRALLRARLFVRAVLPLLAPIVAAEPRLVPARRSPARVHIGLAGGGLGAAIELADGAARVLPATDAGPADVSILFRDVDQLNRFFSGGACWPRVRGALRHPLVLLRTLRLLLALQILKPGAGAAPPRSAQVLRVRVLLLLVARSLTEMARSGGNEFAAWVAASPERVLQWSAGPPGEDADRVAVYVRIDRGRIHAARGLYGHRRPFVHFAFRDVPAAFSMLTAQETQMTGVRDGLLATIGSPEYVRKIALQMQKIDALLLEG